MFSQLKHVAFSRENVTENISKYPVIKLVRINQTPLNISRNIKGFILSKAFIWFTENLDLCYDSMFTVFFPT